jgi:RimJ/RimL family protein N-acetyltransferase
MPLPDVTPADRRPPRHDRVLTPRLVLRHWQDGDREPFAALNADARAMRYFPAPLDRAASDATLDRCQQGLVERGWGLWAVDVVDPAEPVQGFIGFVGLNPPRDPPAVPLPPDPAVEVGWRLAPHAWGRGYAPEAGAAALAIAFESLGLDEVVSFTTTTNAPSRRVMDKLGLRHQPDRDFDHPRTPGWSGRRHVLYAIDAATWALSAPGRSAR